MLPRQPLRFLLADDPGAGKTIMAGLYPQAPGSAGSLCLSRRCAQGRLAWSPKEQDAVVWNRRTRTIRGIQTRGKACWFLILRWRFLRRSRFFELTYRDIRDSAEHAAAGWHP